MSPPDDTRRALAASAAATRALEAEADGALREALEERTATPAWRGDALASALACLADATGLALEEPADRPEDDRARLEAVARRAGLRLLPLEGDPARLEQPALGFRRDGAPLVILPASGQCAVFAAPGHVARPPLAACPMLTALYTFVAPFGAGPTRLPRVLAHAVKGASGGLALLGALSLAGALVGLLLPWAQQAVLDGAVPDGDRGLLLLIGGGLLLTTLCRAAVQWCMNLVLLRVQSRASLRTGLAVHDRVLRLPYTFFRRFSSGDLLQRIGAVEQARGLLEQSLAGALLGGAFALCSFALLLFLSAPLAAIAGLLVLLRGLSTVLVGWLRLRAQREAARLEGENFAWNVQLLEGLSKLRTASAERRAFATWGLRFAGQLRAGLTAGRLSDNFAVLQGALGQAGTLALFLGAGLLAAGGGLGLGVFVAFQATFAGFLGTTDSLAGSVLSLFRLRVLLERARPVLETPCEPTGGIDPGRLEGHVRLEGVSFSYDGAERVLDDVTVEARAGEMIALVGASGCGKSTVCRLLLGLEEPTAGRVLFDGRALGSLDRQALRRQLGVVLQNPSCFGGSLFELIAAGRPVTEREVWEACRAAAIDEELRALPLGLKTRVGAGARELSGGQLQRLLLARALVGSPAVLVLDEATSALDNARQEQVLAHLRGLGRTRVVVAHRVESVRDADRIYLFEKGRVVDSGSFRELVERRAELRRLLRVAAPAPARSS